VLYFESTFTTGKVVQNIHRLRNLFQIEMPKKKELHRRFKCTSRVSN